MIKYVLYFSIILLNGVQAYKLTSLMMTQLEVQSIIDKRSIAADTPIILNDKNVRKPVCKGIIFIDSKNWTVWLDDKLITSNSNSNSKYKVIAVFPDRVEYESMDHDTIYHSSVSPHIIEANPINQSASYLAHLTQQTKNQFKSNHKVLHQELN